ncbi:MAG: pirin family protein [Methanoregula sp.]|nr:pirin family protein [Methanoregula sp.]
MVTYLLEGRVEHEDSMGNADNINAGERSRGSLLDRE